MKIWKKSALFSHWAIFWCHQSQSLILVENLSLSQSRSNMSPKLSKNTRINLCFYDPPIFLRKVSKETLWMKIGHYYKQVVCEIIYLYQTMTCQKCDHLSAMKYFGFMTMIWSAHNMFTHWPSLCKVPWKTSLMPSEITVVEAFFAT